jgi:hypothetical protein
LNYTLTWYFIDETWTTLAIHKEQRIPLRAIYSGFVAGTVDHPDNFELIIDFHEFVFGPEAVPRSLFRVPKDCLVEETPIPLPEIPESFSLISQITDSINRFTYSFKEHFDAPNQRVRFENYSGKEFNVTIVDAKNKKISHLVDHWENDNNYVCTEQVLDTSNHRYFTNNGTLKSIKDLWYFGPRYGVKYTGRDIVRGIRTDHWFTHFNTSSLYGLKDHYWTHEFHFAIESWKNPSSGAHRVPIRSVLKAFPISRFTHRPSHIAVFHQTYDYSDYQPKLPSPRLFRPLLGCPGYKPYQSKYSDEFGLAASLMNYSHDVVYFIASFTTLSAGVVFGFCAGVFIAFFVSRVAVSKTPSGKGFGRVNDDVTTDL